MENIETERLRLRPFAPDLSDLEAMLLVLEDPVSMRFYSRPFDRDGTRAWIEQQLERYRTDGFGLYAIEDRATGEVLGDCGPTIQPVDQERFVELGWHVRPDRQGEGIASEAGVAIRDHCFATMDVRMLISLIRPASTCRRGVWRGSSASDRGEGRCARGWRTPSGRWNDPLV